jgi:hypothetical protein
VGFSLFFALQKWEFSRAFFELILYRIKTYVRLPMGRAIPIFDATPQHLIQVTENASGKIFLIRIAYVS